MATWNSSNDSSAAEVGILNDYTRFMRRFTIFCWLFGILNAIFLGITPLVQWFRIDYSTKVRMYGAEEIQTLISNSTLPNPPKFLRLWMPIHKKWKYFYVTYVIQIVYTCLNFAFAPCLHCFMMVIMVHPVITIEQIIYKLEHTQEYVDEFLDQLEDAQIQKPKIYCSDYVRCCVLKDCILRHLRTIKFVMSFQNAMEIVQFLDITIFTLAICGTLYQASKLPFDFRMVGQLCFMVGGVYVFFWYYWQANEIYLMSDKISSAIFRSNWYVGSLSYQRNVQIFAAASSSAIVLRAGFIEMNLSTFIAIMRASYSYYAVLRQMDMK